MNELATRVLQGEILPPEDGVDIVVSLNMFSSSHQIIRVPSGSTLEECVTQAEKEFQGPRAVAISVVVGDSLIPPEYWRRMRIKRGAFVGIYGCPGKDENSNRSLLLIAVAIAAIAATFALGPAGFAIYSATTASLIGTAILAGGGLLVNQLIPMRPPVLENSSGASSSPTYSISGGSNKAEPFGPIPFFLGKNRVFPKAAARPYTEFEDNDQILYMLFCWGYGPINVNNMMIGETPLSNYEKVSVEHDLNFISTTETMSLFPSEVIQDDLTITLDGTDNGPDWHLRTTAANCDRIGVDVQFAAGVYQIDKETNKRIEYKVRIKIQYRKVGTSAWKSFDKQIDINSRKPKAIRITILQDVARAQYEVQVGKSSSDNTDSKNQIVQEATWTALRTYRTDAPIEFGTVPLAVTALKIQATGQLNGAISALNAVVDSKQLSYNGSAWVAGALSQNPADLYRYVLQGPFNARPIIDAQLDLIKIQAFWTFCNTKGYRFNMVRDFRSSVWDCASDVCAAGRGFPVFVDGKWSVVFDDGAAAISGHYTPRNSRGFTEERVYTRPPHAFRGRFINEDMGYKEDERYIYDDGYDVSNATLFEQIEFPGVTDSDLVWKHGRFHIAQQRLRPSTYSLIVAREHFRNTVGDRVRVQHYLPLWGLVSGRVKSIAGSVVTLDEVVTMVTATNYSIRITQPGTGTTFTRTVLTTVGSSFQITLTGSGSAPVAGDLFSFGEASLETVNLRIKKISYLDEAEAKLYFQDDAPELQTADTGVIPAFNSQITIPPDPQTVTPRVEVQERTPTTGETDTSGAHVAWELPVPSQPSTSLPLIGEGTPVSSLIPTGALIHYKASEELEWENLGHVAFPNFSVNIDNLIAGLWDFRVKTVFDNGKESNWTSVLSFPIVGKEGIPDDVLVFSGNVSTDFIRLEWDAVPTPGVDHYVIRFAPVLSGAEWSSAQTLADNVKETNILLPTLVGTYLIKAVNVGGVESANPAEFASDAAGLRVLNAILLVQEDPTWTGTKVATEVSSGSLRLIATGGILSWPAILSTTPEYWTTQFPLEGSYHPAVVDLGQVYTSRVTANINAAGDNINNIVGAWGRIGQVGLIGGNNASGWSVKYEERHTPDNPAGTPVWTDWAEIKASADYTFRAIDRRLILTSLSPDVRPVVASASLSIDMPDTSRAETNVTIASDGMRVVFTPAFRIYSGLGISHQILANGVRITTSSEDATGFNVTAKDPSGVFVSGQKFSYNAKGAGTLIP